MNRLEPSLRIEVVWLDSHMLELQLSVNNADFAGRANFYAALDELETFAKMLRGFPTSAADVREYEFGEAGLPGYGGAKVNFYCKDKNGHLLIQASVHRNPTGNLTLAESATVRFDAVPASIDSFVEELLRMKLQVGESANLHREK